MPSGCASSRSSSRKRTARCRCSPAPAATTRSEADPHGRRDGAGAASSGFLSVTPVLQQADAGRARISTTARFAESTPLPIIVYNVPGRTGVNVEPSTLARLAQIPNIVGVKEASGNVTQMCEICRAVPADFLVLSGDDALTLPLMAVGGHGIISVAANEIPAEMVQMVEAAERNDFAAARAVHARILPLMRINFVESNPRPVKAAMAAMGLHRRDVPAADGVADGRSRRKRSTPSSRSSAS